MILRNFVVFEGIDGTGTTTQLKQIEKRYRALSTKKQVSFFFTCEPTDSEIGRLVRRGLKGELYFRPETIARLFAADRGEHLFGEDGIIAHLNKGYVVYSDRYLFSSLAYQGEACDPALPHSLNKDFPLPEYLFFFDIDPDAAMERVVHRAATLEIYEKLEFQKRVRARYLDIISEYEKKEPNMQIIKIDASNSVDEIAAKIWSIAGNLPKITT